MDAVDRVNNVEEFLEQTSSHLDNALMGSRVTISCQDRELRFIWIYHPTMGLHTEKMIGKRMEDFASPTNAEVISVLKREVIETGKAQRVTRDIITRGQRKFYDMTITPVLHDDTVVGVTMLSVDISDLVSAQEELAEARVRLLDLLGDGVRTGRMDFRP